MTVGTIQNCDQRVVGLRTCGLTDYISHLFITRSDRPADGGDHHHHGRDYHYFTISCQSNGGCTLDWPLLYIIII